jgi:hypothetical protein
MRPAFRALAALKSFRPQFPPMLKPAIPRTSISAVDVYGASIVGGLGLYGMGNSKGFPPAAVRSPLEPKS